MQLPTIMPGGSQEVVGEGRRQQALIQLSGGKTPSGCRYRLVTAELVLEPENPHDPDAVRVEIGGHLVGYIPADDAPTFHELIGELWAQGRPATCRAELTGGWDRGARDQGNIGIELDVHWELVPADGSVPLLPGERQVSLTGEEHCQEILEGLRRTDGQVFPLAWLFEAEANPYRPQQAEPCVGVTVGQQTVGYLTTAMTRRYLGLVHSVAAAGLGPTCHLHVQPGDNKLEAYVMLPDPDRL